MGGSTRAEAALVGVYRRRNARHADDVTKVARAAGWTCAWWALDEIAPELADVTVGTGSGLRLPLLNQVVARAGIEEAWIVVSDDDLVFTRGDLSELLTLCARACFDLAQPARSDDNRISEFNVAHPITLSRRLSRARQTTFVEIGPLFVVGPDWRDRIVPFPEERGMGWGLELDWLGLHRSGCRLGIVDQVCVAHVGQVWRDYDHAPEVARVHDELARLGLTGWKEIQHTLATWRPWQRRPPWLTSD